MTPQAFPIGRREFPESVATRRGSFRVATWASPGPTQGVPDDDAPERCQLCRAWVLKPAGPDHAARPRISRERHRTAPISAVLLGARECASRTI